MRAPTIHTFGVENEAAILAKRPFINSRGDLAIDVPIVVNGQMKYRERVISSAGNFNVNATLRKDEWVSLDLELLAAFRERLSVVELFRSKGLTHNPGGIGAIVSEWEASSEITDAAIDMHGEPQGRGQKDRQEFGLYGVPIPVIHKEFDIGERVLMASRQRGASLDVTTGLEAARSCARTIENLVVNGTGSLTVVSDGNTYVIYGLTNFPQRNTLATLSDWSATATAPDTILSEILEMISVAEADRRFGPFALIIPSDCSFQFYDDYKAESDKTLMQRVKEDPRIAEVVVSDVLAAGNVLLVQLDKETLDLAIAADESTIQWASGSGWTNHFQTYAAVAPRFKRDYDGRSGIVHGTEGS